MSPTEKIMNWLGTLPPTLQREFAFFVLVYNIEGMARVMADEQVLFLKKWLDPNDKSYILKVGKAIAFREAVNFSLSHRFSDEGWIDTREHFEKVVKEAEADPTSTAAIIVDSARDMLAKLPDRISQWKAVGESWQELASKELTDEALRQWEKDQRFKHPA